MAWRTRLAARLLHSGGVIAYPTEAVYGLGCDPLDGEAIERLLALKGRDVGKGLILIAADLGQLRPYLELPENDRLDDVKATWPGPTTWLLPAAPDTPFWLTGGRPALAVRVTAHAPSIALCRAFGGAIVSTSANPAGRAPARNALTVRRYFGTGVDAVLSGPIDQQRRPSEIRDFATGAVLRAGG